MLTTRRMGTFFLVLALALGGQSVLLAGTPERTPTPFPKLLGGFGRPRETPLPAPTAGPYDARLLEGAPLPDGAPLSFDTKGYDWSVYAAEMIKRIKLHWDVPELARLGWKASLTIRFYILADGRVGSAKIIRYSGIPPFDNAALQAILKSSPFRPLPEELHEQREGVTVTFLYNMSVGESKGGAPRR